MASRAADRYFELKSQIHRKLIGVLNLERVSSIPKDRVRAEIGRVVERLLDEERVPMTTAEQSKIVEEVLDEVLGLGPLETLLKEPTISDILVNRYNKVFIERNGKLSETGVRFKDDAHLLHIIEKIVSQVGRRIDEAQPIVDARLQDGSRVNAIIPPLALDGPCLSIRRFGRHVITQEEMLQYKTITPGMLRFLAACVQSKATVLISGGTGSGKTTMLNALSRFIPEEERIITIEDTAELQLQQRHVVKFETRPPNLNKEGGINQRQLLRTALRMRPDRIIVGECRGAEALDMLQAMNTGVEGSMSTVHANTPKDAFSRLETMVMMADLEIAHQHHGFQARKGIARRVGMYRAHGALHAAVHRLKHFEGFRAPALADDDTVRPHAQGGAKQMPLADSASLVQARRASFKLYYVPLLQLQFSRVFDGDDALLFRNEAREGIKRGRLAGAGSA